MAFDTKRAERTVVEIVDDVSRGRRVGMGFRLLDDVIATACRCLPHVHGRVCLPDPDRPSSNPVVVVLRRPGTSQLALAAVIDADPCADFALLGALPTGASGERGSRGSVEPSTTFDAIIAGLQPAPVELTPFRGGPVSVYTHEGRWVGGFARPGFISPRSERERIRSETSGAPVFDQRGGVVGLVGYNDVRLSDASMCVLADQLPGWALRRLGGSRRADALEALR